MATRILILDDSELIVEMLTMICDQLGYQTITATRLDQVQRVIDASSPPDLVLSDLNLPDVPGDPIAALRALPTLAATPIVLVSGLPQKELDRIASERGAQGALSKDAGLPGMMMQLGPLVASLT